jgi:excisionase family DNA binding protein
MTEEQLLTVREVARRCRRSEETVRRWVWSGKLPARKLGNQLFIEAAELARILPELRVSESAVAYRPRAGGRARSAKRSSVRRSSLDMEKKRLSKKYDYSSIVQDIREHRGQLLPSREEALRHIEEDEAFQDEVLEKYGPVDVVQLLRKVREE